MGERVKGKVAVVTGAASGIGEASARALAAEGAAVAVTDVDVAGGERVAGEIAAAGGTATFLRHDVADEDAWRRVVAETRARFGGLHVLVNNAGIGGAQRLTEMDLDAWRRMMAVNLDGVFLGMKHAIPVMVASGSGSIVNISSIDGIMGAPLRAHYCAAKGGVRTLTKAVAMECCQLGQPVRVNSVHPGPVATNIFINSVERSAPAVVELMGGAEGIMAYYTSNTALGRFAEPREIAAAVLFLASDESSYVTGAELPVDGGWTGGRLIRGGGA
jgi:NAD(P)-dependent dehydrogenase (short-subunit alcohol dehydrogenase family)